MGSLVSSATGTANGFVSGVSSINRLPTPPVPVNYVSWIVGIAPTAVAGLNGFWALAVGAVGLLIALYTLSTCCSSLGMRCCGAPTLRALGSASESIDRNRDSVLRGLASKRAIVGFFVWCLGQWIVLSILSIGTSVLLFGVALLNDLGVIIPLLVYAQSWMYLTSTSEITIRTITWFTDVIRRTYNLGAMSLNGVNIVSARWFIPWWNVAVFFTISLLIASSGLVNSVIDLGAANRRLMQEEFNFTRSLQQATRSPTSASQTKVFDFSIQAQISGLEDLTLRYEPYATLVATGTALVNSLILVVYNVFVGVVGPILGQVIDAAGQVFTILGCAISWVGAQCTAREGLAIGLNAVGGFVRDAFGVFSITVGPLNWGDAIKCTQADAGNSISCACSSKANGFLSGINNCCPIRQECRYDSSTNEYFYYRTQCGTRVADGVRNPSKAVACPNPDSSTRRFLLEQTFLSAEPTCVHTCVDGYEVESCPFHEDVVTKRKCRDLRLTGANMTLFKTPQKTKTEPDATQCMFDAKDPLGTFKHVTCMFEQSERTKRRLAPDDMYAAAHANVESMIGTKNFGSPRRGLGQLTDFGIWMRARRHLDHESPVVGVVQALAQAASTTMLGASMPWGLDFVNSTRTLFVSMAKPLQAERNVQLRKQQQKRRRLQQSSLPCTAGIWASRTNCACPFECPDGSCADTGALCPYPKQWTIGIGYDWLLLKSELFLQEFEPIQLAESVYDCWNTIIKNPEKNPVSFQNIRLTYDQRLQTPELQWCWPMIREWPFGELPGSEFDFSVWVDATCVDGVCQCPSYWGFHYTTDLYWVNGVYYFEPTRFHDGLLAGWSLFTYYGTQGTWLDTAWQFVTAPFYPIVPMWMVKLFANQNQQETGNEQLVCALYNFGTTLWLVFMLRVISLFYVTTGYVTLVRLMELVSIVEILLETIVASCLSDTRQMRSVMKKKARQQLDFVQKYGVVRPGAEWLAQPIPALRRSDINQR